MFKRVWSLTLTILLTGCIGGAGDSQIELSGFNTTSSGSSIATSSNITSVNIVNNQLVLAGTKLDTITNIRVTGPSSFDETFAIESQSENSLIANGLNNIAFGVAGIFSLIITDAQGASSYTITFTVADDSITGAMISDMSASNGDALTFNSGTGEWEPTPLSGLNLVGTWNANTDSPDLADGGANTSPSNGDFYVVGTTGTTNIDGTTTWNAGDWILFNGTTWERVANSSGVISFNGRMGAISPMANDYTWAQIDKTTSPINDLSDINTSGAVSGSILKFDGTNWIVGTDNDTGGSGVNNSTSTILNADNNGDGSGDIDFQINSSTVASIKNNGDFFVGTNTFVVDDSTSSIGLGVLAPSYDLSLSGDSDKAIGMERHSTSDTAGSDLFLYTGGATSGATDKDGGDLYIASGTATGSGNSHIYLQTATAGSSGTADNSPNTKMTILGSGNVGIGTVTPNHKLEVDGDIYVTTSNDICITGGNCLSSVGGETNTASNVGTAGIGVYKQKTTANLEFKNINAGSTKITLTDDTANNEIDIDVDESNINHDNLAGFVANEHIDHSSVSITTGANSGLTGGGDLTSTRNLSVDISGTTAETVIASADEVLIYDASATALRKMTWTNFVNGLATSATTITTGDGITGGGDLSTNRTISIDLATNPGLEFSSNQLRAKVNTGLTLDSNGINIDVGTGANQIVQLDGSARLPAIDGSLLTNLSGAVVGSLDLDGDTAKTISMDRHSTGDTAGNNLTINSGGATSAATDKNGGDLILSAGMATGTGSSTIQFQTATAQGSTNTSDNTPNTKMTILGSGNVGIGTVTPNQKLEVDGNVYVTSGNDICITGGNCLGSMNTGTVTSISGGDGLSNGPITTSGTLSVNVDDTTIEINTDSLRLKDDGITNAKINSSAAIAYSKLNIADGDLSIAKTSGLQTALDAKTDEATTITAGAGLSGGGDLSANRSIAVDINGTTAETTIAGADEVLIYDASVGALRKMTWTNFTTGLGGGAWTDTTGDLSYTAGSVSVGTSTQDASAVLQVSSTTQGFLPPRMTTAQRTGIASPTEGLMVYDTDLDNMYIYKDSAWGAIGSFSTGTTYAGGNYFVLTESVFNGDFGGLAGANHKCFLDLYFNDWKGKSNVNLKISNVRAFLCESGNDCQNTLANTTYTFARSGDASGGGDTFTTDGTGRGPGDSNLWNVATKFNGNANFWTGRKNHNTENTHWLNESQSECTDWSTSSSGVNGRIGRSNDSDHDRWTYTNNTCNNVNRLICIVDAEAETVGATSADPGSSLGDDDSDTKIQLEEASDDDTIRFDTDGSERMVISATGNIGIGTATPSSALEVDGAIRSAASVSNGTSTIDFDSGNIQYTTSNCGSYDLHNLKDGGAYTFIIQGTTAATCAFSAYSDAGSTALTVHLPSGHGATTAGEHTIYSIVVAGTHVYLAWVTEFD